MSEINPKKSVLKLILVIVAVYALLGLIILLAIYDQLVELPVGLQCLIVLTAFAIGLAAHLTAGD